jgi:CRISPR-associated protein (TIGR03984 family)
MDRDRDRQVTLVYQERVGIGLPEVLDHARRLPGLTGAVALLSSPTRCELGRLDSGGGLRGPAGEVQPRDGVFEARLFSPNHDLRWTLDTDGGRAFLLSEGEAADLTGWTVAARVPVERLAVLTYLLMGWSDGPVAEGWTRLSAGRTRSIDVPFETSARRIALRAVEYAARDPQHGNVHVCEERILKLEPASVPPLEGRSEA